MALSTKNLPPQKSGIAKTIKPGNVYARIIGISLKEDKYQRDNGNEDAYSLNLHLEGPDLGEEFEGFLIDKDDESKGRYKGQVATVKTNQGFSYFNKTVGNRDYVRDDEILKELQSLAKALGKTAELDAIEAESIEEYVPKASEVLSGDDSWLYFCIGGQEYEKNGYPNYYLSLVKSDFKKKKYTYAADEENVVKFDADKHVFKKKSKTEVDEFEPVGTDVVDEESPLEPQDELPF